MSFAPSFDFYPERWLAGTMHLTDDQQLRYFRLLCHAWIMDGLPTDKTVLERLAGGSISPEVLEKFPPDEGGKLRNKRLEQIRREQQDRIEQFRVRAQRAAEARWAKGDASGNAQASDKHSLRTSSSNAQAYPQALHEECLPPSTVHRPPFSTLLAAPEVEEAQKWAAGCGVIIPPDCVQAWHDDRTRVGWVTIKGQTSVEIKDWRADLRTYARHWRDNEAKGKPAVNGSHGPVTTTTKGTTSVWQIKQQIEAAEESIAKIRGIHLFRNLPTEKQEKITALRKRVKELRDKLNALPE